jgi:hypothetical protein
MRSKLVLAIVLAGASCSSGSSTPDLSPDGAIDGTPAGETPVAGLCSGTPVAGTCVATFFQAALACFVLPETGACTTQSKPRGSFTDCWSNGARVEATVATDKSQHLVFTSGSGTECLQADTAAAGTLHTLTRGGQKLVLDDAKGSATCPDGKTVSIPNGLRACAALLKLLEPQCATGTCP